MTYSATRDREQLRYLEVDIASFIQAYQSRPPGIQRRTLFLFPGGMGSQLLRARTRYQTGGPQTQTFQYDPVWLTLGTFLGDSLNLKMHDVGGVYQDLGDRIIIPYGSVEFLGLTPYTRFIAWCELNDIDWFVFGWDWRRRLEDTVSFFLNRFLPRVQSIVEPQCGDVLQDYALVGHSFGGMVVTLMLHQNHAMLSTMGRTITVASPFYGYDGQIHRWFEGEPLLNHIGPIDITPEVIEVIASLPGVYVLPYLDKQTFQNNQAALAADPHYPLNAYPSHDSVHGTLTVDPFSPGANRYPQNIGFSTNELHHARNIYRKIAAGAAPAICRPFLQYSWRPKPATNDARFGFLEIAHGAQQPGYLADRDGAGHAGRRHAAGLVNAAGHAATRSDHQPGGRRCLPYVDDGRRRHAASHRSSL